MTTKIKKYGSGSRKHSTPKRKKNLYSVILVKDGRLIQYLGNKPTELRAYQLFNKLLKECESVKFPIKVKNSVKISPCEYELAIIKQREWDDPTENKVMDDDGKFVTYKSSSEDWIVIDRAPYKIEETFWVYGYHPKLQRKDFSWVFSNIIIKDYSKENFKLVVVYHNKLLVECNGELEIVICKNNDDCVRLSNTIEQECLDRKLKYIGFLGDIKNSRYKRDWMQKIQDTTNWNRKKVKRTSTRP